MIKTISLTANVSPEREVRIVLPNDVPPGPTDFLVVVVPQATPTVHSLGDLAHSEFFGMWHDRTDIADSAEFARQLRAKAWRRSAE